MEEIEKECSSLGGLFQSIINDMKGSSVVWEDFTTKAIKLHSQLKATIAAASLFLDAFQKVADMATNTRGATKDIGTALTRICLRHRSIEARLKTFTSSIMDCLVLPLQEKMEEWKKTVTQLDKDHAKEYKKARHEIKKRASDTLRLQKKVRKASKPDIQKSLDNALQEVNDKYLLLEETEKTAVRTALIEERSRFCLFVSCLKPVVDEEVAMLGEITHLQEIMEVLGKHVTDPFTLPAASEQVILDIKGSDSSWSFQTPPSSPSSLGSRKSSMCSISSLNSSSSGSTKSHSPSHHFRYRCLSQVHTLQPPPQGALRLSSVSSQDSGFTSQDTLFMRPPTPPPLELTLQNSLSENSSGSTCTSSNSSTPSSPYPGPPSTTATWPNLQETQQYEKPVMERPHTISTAYERSGPTRPALTSQTFEPPDRSLFERPQATSTPSSPSPYEKPVVDSKKTATLPLGCKPPLPEKMSMHERLLKSKSKYATVSIPTAVPMVPDFGQSPYQIPQPLYVNMNEIANMAAQTAQQRPRSTIDPMVGSKQMPSQSELAIAVARSLTGARRPTKDSRSPSRCSLQSSSGYGTQNTSSSSEDTITSEADLASVCSEDSDREQVFLRNGDVVTSPVVYSPVTPMVYSPINPMFFPPVAAYERAFVPSDQPSLNLMNLESSPTANLASADSDFIYKTHIAYASYNPSCNLITHNLTSNPNNWTCASPVNNYSYNNSRVIDYLTSGLVDTTFANPPVISGQYLSSGLPITKGSNNVSTGSVTHPQPPAVPNRPASTTGIPMRITNLNIAQARATLRRHSINTTKPPPPVRRSSSISAVLPPIIPGVTDIPLPSSKSSSLGMSSEHGDGATASESNKKATEAAAAAVAAAAVASGNQAALQDSMAITRMNLIQSLNAKFAAQQQAAQEAASGAALAFSEDSAYESWINGRASITEDTPVKETLLEQIKRGTKLRKVPTNDRSAPRIS